MPTPQGIVRPSEVYNTYSTQGTLDALEFAGNNVCYVTKISLTIYLSYDAL